MRPVAAFLLILTCATAETDPDRRPPRPLPWAHVESLSGALLLPGPSCATPVGKGSVEAEGWFQTVRMVRDSSRRTGDRVEERLTTQSESARLRLGLTERTDLELLTSRLERDGHALWKEDGQFLTPGTSGDPAFTDTQVALQHALWHSDSSALSARATVALGTGETENLTKSGQGTYALSLLWSGGGPRLFGHAGLSHVRTGQGRGLEGKPYLDDTWTAHAGLGIPVGQRLELLAQVVGHGSPYSSFDLPAMDQPTITGMAGVRVPLWKDADLSIGLAHGVGPASPQWGGVLAVGLRW